MVEPILHNFKRTSVYASYKDAFETIPLWFTLNKEKSVAMQQMVEFVLPTMNVLRYHHFVECNEAVHEFVENHKAQSVMSIDDAYELLSNRFPLQVGNMVVANCCATYERCNFTKLFDALLHRDRKAFCDSAAGILPHLSLLIETWRESYSPFRLMLDNDISDVDAEALILALINVMDFCNEKTFGELKEGLYRCHFILKAEEINSDNKIQDFSSQANSHLTVLYTVLYHNIYRKLEPEWLEDHPLLESLLIDCRQRYNIPWEGNSRLRTNDVVSPLGKIDLNTFGENDSIKSRRVRRRKTYRPITNEISCQKITQVGNTPIYYNIELPGTDDGDGIVESSKSQPPYNEPPYTNPPKLPIELQSNEFMAILELFIEHNYIEITQSGQYNWIKESKRLFTMWIDALEKKGVIRGNKWEPFQKAFLCKGSPAEGLSSDFAKITKYVRGEKELKTLLDAIKY